MGRNIKGMDMENHKEVIEACKKQEEFYWLMHENLLRQYHGQWVAVADGSVVAAGENPLTVTSTASKKGVKHAYINRVGFESQTRFKIRRISFSYDTEYTPFPIPKASAKLHNANKTACTELSDVIVDTGADVTCMRENDCDQTQLAEGGAYLHTAQEYGESEKLALFYQGIIEIDGKEYPAFIQMVGNSDERLLGRDVLNQLTAIFQGKEKRVIIE